MTNRIIDVVDQVERAHDEQLGVVPGRELVSAIKSSVRRSGDAVMTAAFTSYWHRANIGLTGDAAYLLRVAVPSADTTWAMANMNIKLPNVACYVAGCFIWSSDARSGGTATPRLRVIDSVGTTDYDFPDAVLDGTNTSANACILVNSSIRLAAGAAIEGRVVTAGTWAPTTADVTVAFMLTFET